MDTYDEQMLPWLQLFSRYDLYSKANSEVDFQSLMPYYKNLIDTYIPQLLRW